MNRSTLMEVLIVLTFVLVLLMFFGVHLHAS